MSVNAPINFSFAGLPEGYCFKSFNQYAIDIAGGMSGFLQGQYNVFNYGSDTPAAEDRGKPWLRLFTDGTPDRWYIFYGGQWVARNPREQSSSERMWWTGTESELWSYDGGDGQDPSSTAPTATTGAMWQKDTDYDGRFPLSAGTIPDSGGTVVAVGATGGEWKHALTADENGPHTHRVTADTDATAENENTAHYGGGGDNDTPIVTKSSGLGDPHNTFPTYRVGLWAKRTARIYYVPTV